MPVMNQLGRPYIVCGRLARLEPLSDEFAVRFERCGASGRLTPERFAELDAAGTLMPISESTYSDIVCQMNKRRNS